VPGSAPALSAEDLARLGEYLAERVAEKLAERRDRLWTEEQAAGYLGVSTATLYRMRTAGEVPYLELKAEGKKRPLIRYEPETLRAWARAGGCRVRGRKSRRAAGNSRAAQYR